MPGRPLFGLKRILVTTDFSQESRKAFRYAAAFAEQFGASIDVVTVVEPAPFMAGMEAVPIALNTAEVRAAAQRKLEDWIEADLPPSVQSNAMVREGKPFQEIITAAKECRADLIVISTHGYSGLKHAFMGSTAERVVRHAACPVLVVREKEHEFVAD